MQNLGDQKFKDDRKVETFETRQMKTRDTDWCEQGIEMYDLRYKKWLISGDNYEEM